MLNVIISYCPLKKYILSIQNFSCFFFLNINRIFSSYCPVNSKCLNGNFEIYLKEVFRVKEEYDFANKCKTDVL